MPFRFSYNSQNWRYDSSGVWKMGTDVGYGWGWKLLAGSLTPVYSDWFTVHHYKFTDATGAEYRLDSAAGGIWTSSEGIFLEYDAAAGRLYFPNGMFWEFGCTANGIEADAGTMYPTRFVDRNGNEIKVRYKAGVYYSGANSSGRISEVEDVRAAAAGGGYRTYAFNYTTDAWPHLTEIVSEIGDGFYLAPNYTNNVTLYHPYYSNAGYGGVTRLNGVTLPTGGAQGFGMEYGDGMELTKATLPYGATLEWVYGTKALNNGRSLREVTQRKLNTKDGAGTRIYTIGRDDAGDTNRYVHWYAQVVDASGVSDKVYYFHTAADYRLGLMSSLVERKISPTPTVDLRWTEMTWAQVGSVPYIAATVETMDPGTGSVKKSKMEQEIDSHGNVKWKKVYPYYTSTPGTVRNHFRYNPISGS